MKGKREKVFLIVTKQYLCALLEQLVLKRDGDMMMVLVMVMMVMMVVTVIMVSPTREPLFHLPAGPPAFLLQSQHLRYQRPSSEIGSTHSFEAKLN